MPQAWSSYSVPYCLIDGNKIGDMSETPLHIAVRKGNSPVAKALLNAGAKTDIISEFGKSAKDLAEESSINMEVKK